MDGIKWSTLPPGCNFCKFRRLTENWLSLLFIMSHSSSLSRHVHAYGLQAYGPMQVSPKPQARLWPGGDCRACSGICCECRVWDIWWHPSFLQSVPVIGSVLEHLWNIKDKHIFKGISKLYYAAFLTWFLVNYAPGLKSKKMHLD